MSRASKPFLSLQRKVLLPLVALSAALAALVAWQRAGWLLLGVLSLAAMAYGLLRRHVLTPVKGMVIALERRKRGEEGVLLPVLANDEIGTLAHALNQMFQALDTGGRQILESEARYRSVVEDAQEVFFKTDSEGRWIFLNPAWKAITGFSVEQSLGTYCFLPIHADDRAACRSLLNATIEARTDCFCSEVRYVTQSGAVRWGQVLARISYDAEGRVTQATGTFGDTTDRKQAEIQLAERIERANRLAEEADCSSKAKSDFLATMSHEIRTPMNGVIGFTDMLLDTPLDPQQREYTQIIKDSGESLLALLNDILDFSKIEANKLTFQATPFDLRLASKQVIDLLCVKAAEKGIALTLEIGLGVPSIVVGDPMRVRQVLVNLVGNAIKFTSTGEVRVHLSHSESDEARQLEEPFVELRVTDSGIGISAEKQTALFQRFTQADSSTTRKYGGTGLGLAISKRLVEMMGGRIGLESQVGSGSTFWFTFPCDPILKGEVEKPPGIDLAPSDPPCLAPIVTPATSSQGSSGALRNPRAENIPSVVSTEWNVLLAEDNTVNQRLAMSFLKKLGCRVDLAVNGRQAVEMVKKMRYDAVFMDWQMPEMDGAEATRQIRHWEAEKREDRPASPRIPIIAVTANAMQGDRERCLAAGMDEYVTKPINLVDLRRALETLVLPRPDLAP